MTTIGGNSQYFKEDVTVTDTFDYYVDSSGGTSFDVGSPDGNTVLGGGVQYIETRATAQDTSIYNGGEQHVYGTAETTTISVSGFQYLYGGTAIGTTISAGFQYDNGTAISTTINGGEQYGFEYVGYAGSGSATATTINSGGIQIVGFQSGTATAANTTISSGGWQYVGNDGAGGTALGTTIDTGGKQFVGVGVIYSDNGQVVAYDSGTGAATNTTISGGMQWVGFISGTGAATSTTIDSGGTQIVGDNSSGRGTAADTRIGAGGRQYLLAGGTSISTTLAGVEQSGEYGFEAVSSGGVASDTVILSGGDMRVFSRGLATSTVVESTGFGSTEGGLALYGGTATGTVINNGGQEGVKSGGTDLDATVNDGGALFVESGGTGNGTTVEGGGELVVFSGGSDILEGLADGGTAIIDGARLELSQDALVGGSIDFDQNSGGTLQIDGTTMPTATISGFVSGEKIELADVNFSSGGTAVLDSKNELHVTMGGNTYLLQLDPSRNYSGSVFTLSPDGTEINVADAASLFTSGADIVNFNALTAKQKSAIASGASVYDGLGGNDVVTLPNVSNYDEPVGDSGQTLNWQNSPEQPFSTDSRQGDTYTVSGGDGNYFIDAGAGTDVITISGNGSSTIVGSSGSAKIEFEGTGDNLVSAGTGTEIYELIEAAGTNGKTAVSGIVDAISGAIVASGIGAHVDLEDGTVISGGTLQTVGASAAIETVGNGFGVVISAVTIASNSNLTVSNTTLALEGIINNRGAINVNAASVNTMLAIVGSVTLSGGGKVNLISQNGDTSQIIASGGEATLTNVNNTIAGAGTITDNFLILNNSGTINANTSAALTIGAAGSLITNSGTLEATSTGGLVIDDIVGNTKTIQALGTKAAVVIGGTAINTGSAKIVASGSGAHVDLDNATIRGGTLKTAGTGAVIDAASGTTDLLGGATIAAGASVKVNDGATLIIAGVLVNSGTVVLSAANRATQLAISGGVTLSGGGKVTLSNDSNNAISAAADTLASLTNLSNTIQGAGTLGVNDLTVVNKGIINANSSTALILATGNAETTNSGTLEATSSGGLDIESVVVNGKTIGAIGNGAKVEIESIVSNTSAGLIQASGKGAHVDLSSATVSGGTLKTSGSGAVIDATAGTLNLLSGVTLAKGTIVEVLDNATLSLLGIIKNSGTISMGAAGDPTALGVPGGLTLSGGGKVTLSDNSANAFDVDGGAVTITNVNNTIAGAGTIGNANLTLVNSAAGVVDGNGLLNTLRLFGVISNAGTLEGATSQGLTLSGTITNAKTIEASGKSATVEILDATITNASTALILASGAGAQVLLDGVTISGGNLKTSGTNALIEAVGGGTDSIGGCSIAASSLLEVASGSTFIFSGGTIGAAAAIETLAGGTAMFSGVIGNSGTLFASGSNSLVEIAGGTVVSGGIAEVGNGAVDIAGSSSESVSFLSNGVGGLEIADMQGQTSAFSGRVSGFGGSGHSNHEQFIDLISVTSALNTISLSYVSAAAHTSGTLFVSSGGVTVAAINMVGVYTSANFSALADSDGHVEIVDPIVANGGSIVPGPSSPFPRHGLDLADVTFGAQTTLAYPTSSTTPSPGVTEGQHAAALALLGNYMAGSFARSAGGGILMSSTPQTEQPLLTHPPH